MVPELGMEMFDTTMPLLNPEADMPQLNPEADMPQAEDAQHGPDAAMEAQPDVPEMAADTNMFAMPEPAPEDLPNGRLLDAVG